MKEMERAMPRPMKRHQATGVHADGTGSRPQPSATRNSLREAIDRKCRECGGQDGGDRHWREHVSACPVTTCPLWQVRPLATRNAPAWLQTRDPNDLPEGFLSLSLDEAIASIRANGALVPPVTADNSESKPASMSQEGHTP